VFPTRRVVASLLPFTYLYKLRWRPSRHCLCAVVRRMGHRPVGFQWFGLDEFRSQYERHPRKVDLTISGASPFCGTCIYFSNYNSPGHRRLPPPLNISTAQSGYDAGKDATLSAVHHLTIGWWRRFFMASTTAPPSGSIPNTLGSNLLGPRRHTLSFPALTKAPLDL